MELQDVFKSKFCKLASHWIAATRSRDGEKKSKSNGKIQQGADVMTDIIATGSRLRAGRNDRMAGAGRGIQCPTGRECIWTGYLSGHGDIELAGWKKAMPTDSHHPRAYFAGRLGFSRHYQTGHNKSNVTVNNVLEHCVHRALSEKDIALLQQVKGPDDMAILGTRITNLDLPITMTLNPEAAEKKAPRKRESAESSQTAE